LYEKGMDIEAMAESRNISPATIAQHLLRLKSEGEEIDIQKFISISDQKKVMETIAELGIEIEENMRIQEILEKTGEAVPAWQIRLIVGLEWEKKGKS